MEDLLKVGVITTTHGVRGEVKVFPTTDDAERFLDIEYVLLDTGKELRRLNIKNVKFFKNLAILKFEGIDNINDIEMLREAGYSYAVCPASPCRDHHIFDQQYQYHRRGLHLLREQIRRKKTPKSCGAAADRR